MYNVHVLSNMNVTFKQKRIIITFDKTCEITEILQSIYFYKSSTNFNITKRKLHMQIAINNFNT